MGEGLKGGLWPYTGMGEGLEGDYVHKWAWGGLKDSVSIFGHRGGGRRAVCPYMSLTPPTGSPDWCPAASPAPLRLQAPPLVPRSLSLRGRSPRPIRRQSGPRPALRPIGGAAGGEPRPLGRIHLSVSATPPSSPAHSAAEPRPLTCGHVTRELRPRLLALLATPPPKRRRLVVLIDDAHFLHVGGTECSDWLPPAVHPVRGDWGGGA